MPFIRDDTEQGQPGFDDSDGILGTNFLNLIEAKIDFPGQKLILYQCDPINGARLLVGSLFLQKADDNFPIQVSLNGHVIPAFLDSGANSSIFHSYIAHNLGVTDEDLRKDGLVEGPLSSSAAG